MTPFINLKKNFLKNYLTDVIAPRLNNYEEQKIEGEIYISLPRAKENAKIWRALRKRGC